ncbi:hypothetical protein [Labilibacter marinus]|uniref:hypothetical protein n=1 Tax=Labilibacter marinus TaxID=1477105 RepID=UPI00094FA4D1|nr:hypothetical protein [Labilibacter marinus]
MPVKKIIVPFYGNVKSKYVLEYASELALASNSKLSCICSFNDKSGNNLRNDFKDTYHTKISYLNIINKILYKKNVPYEVILSKNNIIKNIQEISSSGCLMMVVAGMSDPNMIYLAEEQMHVTTLLLCEDKFMFNSD